MVSMRAFCYLLIFFILQLHGKVAHANFNRQVPLPAKNGRLGASTSTQIANKATESVIENRKTLKHENVNVNEKNSLVIESKETVRKRKSKKKLTKTVSLTADYSDPGHHPPRHN
ncbi:hypothetical protein Bca52824_029872 [Brassica carinata]|uniref:Root meristem growth factor 1 n=1 Tax=Brassica carinata TaxID=52824 RepID=A0A8X7V678_BRACI|nr:hypothetical protein Bca52824_029872 [Brassica carinata]